MLAAVGARARRFGAASRPWTNVYGLARTLLALSSALTLAFTPTSALFVPVYGADPTMRCRGVTKVTAFCLDHSQSHELVRALIVVALLVVASGWRPRWTALVHAFITFSIANDLSILDGGDHVSLDLSLLLLPIALTDRRRWHWDAAPADESASLGFEARRLVAAFAWTLIRIQVAAIYFHAAIGKFGVEDWADGTAVYYFFGNPMYGASHTVLSVLRPILENPVGVAAITWGTLMLEYFLSAALVMSKRHWAPMLYLGLLLHAGIIVVHGLLSFALAMFAALILFLRPSELSFDFARWIPARLKLSVIENRKAFVMNQRASSWIKVAFLALVTLPPLATLACTNGTGEEVGETTGALKVIPNPVGSNPGIGNSSGGGGWAPIPVYAPTVFSAVTTSSTVSLSWNEHGGNGQTNLYRQLYDLAGNPTGGLTLLHTFTSLPAGPVTYTDTNVTLRLGASARGVVGVGGGITNVLDPIQPDHQIGYQIIEVASGYSGCEYVPGGSTCAYSPLLDAYTQGTIPYHVGRAELRLGVASATSNASSLHLRAEMSAWNSTWLDSTHGDFKAGSDITYDLLTDNIDLRSDILFLDLWTPDNDGVCVNDVALKIDNTTTFHESFATCQWVGNGGGEIMIPFPTLRSNAAWQSYAPQVFTTSNGVPVTFVGFDGPGLTQHLDAAIGDALKNPIPTPADGANAGLGAATTISRTDEAHLHVQQHLVNLQVEWDGINFGTVSADPSYDLVIHHADSTCSGWCVDVENASGNSSYGWANAILDVLTLGVVPIIQHEVNNHLQNALSGMVNSLPDPQGFGYCFVPTTIDHADPGPVESTFSDDGTPTPFGLGSLTICPVSN